MSAVRIPRLLVLAAASLIVAGPAAYVLGDAYRRNTAGLVKHQHTDKYKVFNDISGDDQLRQQVVNARGDWRAGLDQRKTTLVSSDGSATDYKIRFTRYNSGQTGVKVAFAPDGYHPAPVTATFNSYYTNNMSATEKQGRACNVIGNILGLADAGPQRDDCMEDPTAYSGVHSASLDFADDFYGPNVTVDYDSATSSGLASKDNLQPDQSYDFHATANGHAMAELDIRKGSQTGPLLAQSANASPCPDGEKCERGATATGTPMQLGFGSAGAHTLTVIALNEFGQGGGTADADLAVQSIAVKVAPGVSIDSGPTGPTNDPRPLFGFSSADASASFQCSIDTGTASWGSCSDAGSHQPATSLADGSYTFRVKATDPSGTWTTKTQAFSVDTQEPDTTITSGPSGFADEATFAFTSSESGAAFECRIDAGSWSSCTSPVSVPDPDDGVHSFHVRAIDSAGNPDPTPADREWIADSTPPTLVLAGDMVDTTEPVVGAEPEVTVDATDAGSGVVDITLFVDGENLDGTSEENCPEGACEIEDVLIPDLSDLESGTHTFEVTASDAVGNMSSETGGFTLDQTAPELAVVGDLANADGGPMPGLTASADIQAIDQGPNATGVATIQVSVDSVEAMSTDVSCDPQCPDTASAAFTYDKSDWGPGPHDVTITAIDGAGNFEQTSIEADVPMPVPEAACPTVTVSEQAPGDVLTTEEAIGEVNINVPSALYATEASGDPVDDPDGVLDPSVEDPGNSPPVPLESTGSLSEDAIAASPAAGLTVNDALCLVPMQTTANGSETEGTIVNGDAVLYANTATDTDTVVRPTAAGEAIIENVRGTNPPDTLGWSVGIPAGYELRELTGGAIALVDPLEAASDPAGVPPEPASMDSPEALPVVEAQVQEADYVVAAAEQETGQAVLAVIAEPRVILGDGSVTTANMDLLGGDSVVVDPPNGTRAVWTKVIENEYKLGAPKALPAWYMSATTKFDLEGDAGAAACRFAELQPTALQPHARRRLVLSFGRPHRFKNATVSYNRYGAGHDDKYFTSPEILGALESATRRYMACRSAGKNVDIVYGVTNNHLWENGLNLRTARHAGQWQAITVYLLRDYMRDTYPLDDNVLDVAKGGDIETGWGPREISEALVRAARDYRPRPTGGYYDYGTAGGCTAGGGCNLNWTLTAVGHVSAGRSARPLPEIYDSGDVIEWEHVRQHWNDTHSSRYHYAGVTGQSYDINGSPASTDSARANWRHLYRASNGHVARELISFRSNFPGPW